jgi:hypothetical protein
MPSVLPQTMISPGAQALGLSLQSRTPPAGATYAYALIDLFTTQDGSWEPDQKPYSVPAWARTKYLKPAGYPQYFDDAGGNHHLFARVEDEQGNPIALPIRFWSAGGENITTRLTGEKKSGWANLPIWSSFDPATMRGPWLWGPDGALAVASGGGLPFNQHVSCFAVWRRVKLDAPTPEPPLHMAAVWAEINALQQRLDALKRAVREVE